MIEIKDLNWKSDCGLNDRKIKRHVHLENKQDARDYIIAAEKAGMNVKAYGAGHSYSGVAATDDWAAETRDHLSSVLDLNESWLKDRSKLEAMDAVSDKHKLVAVNAGIKIWKLVRELDKMNLGPINLGSYDQQSLAGAFSNSTHGSGLELGPIGSSIYSITMVSTGGKCYRIEPTIGITDPKRFKPEDDVQLIQDDKYFYSVLVSMGTMGIITSVIMKARTQYWMEEKKKYFNRWEDALDTVRKDDWKKLRNIRHIEFYCNANAAKGKHGVIMCTRAIIDKPVHGKSPDSDRKGGDIFKYLAFPITALGTDSSFGKLMQDVIDKLNKKDKEGWAKFVNGGMAGFFKKAGADLLNAIEDIFARDDSANDGPIEFQESYKNISYEILKIGANAFTCTDGKDVKAIPAYGIEVSLPMSEIDNGMSTVFKFFKSKADDNIVATTPIGIRFVKASLAYLSPQYGRNSFMIEIPVLKGTREHERTMQELQAELLKIEGARMHWGLHMDNLT
eukprot:Opistho-1_new@96865